MSLGHIVTLMGKYDRRVGRTEGWREAQAAMMEIAGKRFAVGHDKEATLIRDVARTIEQHILECIDKPLTSDQAHDIDQLWIQIDERQQGRVPVDGKDE